MPATCFAATPILFAEPVLPDDDAPGSSRFQVPGSVPGSGSAFAITVRHTADTTETRNIEVRQRLGAPVEQTMEAARQRQWTKHATCFATPPPGPQRGSRVGVA
jgi:hypothetical protein